MNGSLDDYTRRGAEIVAACAQNEREIARLQARNAALLAERVEMLLAEVAPGQDGFDPADRSMICEVAAGLRLTKGVATRMLVNARTLHDRLPTTRAAFEAGDLSAAHVDVIAEASRGIPLDDSDALARFEAQVVPFAAAETRMRTKAFAETVVATVASVSLTQNHRRAHEDRVVTVTDDAPGQSTMHVSGPSALIHAAFDLITQEGRAIRKAAGQCGTGLACDPRKLDQIRFDRLLLKALTGVVADDADVLSSIRATVQVTIAATTLAGVDEKMAELDGSGALDPDIARAFASDAKSWERMFIDSTGMVTRTSSYQPTEGMKRYLRARDRTCRFPGCRQAARRCQVDHNHDHARGGATDVCNLCCFCEPHHALKHPDLDPRWRWTAQQGPGGVITWRTPAGVEHTDVPPPRVMFLEEDVTTDQEILGDRPVSTDRFVRARPHARVVLDSTPMAGSQRPAHPFSVPPGSAPPARLSAPF